MSTYTKKVALLLIAAGILAGCATSDAPRPAVLEAIASPQRPADDLPRDADRKPAQVLGFLHIMPGMHVADLMAGGGYYTEILSRAVGPHGVVYMQNNRHVVEKFADKQIIARLADNRLPNVQRLDSELEDPNLPAQQLDVAILSLFYHDTYWMNTDRAAMNRKIYESLRPGGIYAVIDHIAEPGSGDRDVKTLHRVDPELVKKEILAAGFEFDGESNVLRNPDDDHTLNVFKPEIRGKTDQFIFRFRKPRYASDQPPISPQDLPPPPRPGG